MQSNDNDKVSIIIPVIRYEYLRRCVSTIIANAGLDREDFEIITRYDRDRIGCPKMVKKLVQLAKYDNIMFLGDDTLIKPDCVVNALEDLKRFPNRLGLVGIQDGTGRHLPTHWIASRSLLDYLENEEFFYTGYHHCYCDCELRDIAKSMGFFRMSDTAELIHYHPLLNIGNKNNSESDVDYDTIYSNIFLDHDKKLYHERKRQRVNKMAIGFPLVDSNVPVQFFTSYACMDKPEQYFLLLPQFPHGPWTGSIADARNSLVKQAQEEGATHLLMLDTDQTYPPDTLIKLLSHEVDICGVRVHRRWMPFDPIFLRGDISRYKSVPEEEMYSGNLIEVDATGTGCLLFNMKIFESIPEPWFEFKIEDGKPVGEDINFCSKARRAGHRIYIDTSIEVGHLTMIEVNRTLHQICKVIQQRVQV